MHILMQILQLSASASQWPFNDVWTAGKIWTAKEAGLDESFPMVPGKHNNNLWVSNWCEYIRLTETNFTEWTREVGSPSLHFDDVQTAWETCAIMLPLWFQIDYYSTHYSLWGSSLYGSFNRFGFRWWVKNCQCWQAKQWVRGSTSELYLYPSPSASSCFLWPFSSPNLLKNTSGNALACCMSSDPCTDFPSPGLYVD